jgi:hypothetical protein
MVNWLEFYGGGNLHVLVQLLNFAIYSGKQFEKVTSLLGD